MTTRASGLRVGELAESGSLSVDSFLVHGARRDRFLRFTSSSNDPEVIIRSIVPERDGSLTIELTTESMDAVSARSVLVMDEARNVLIQSNLANSIESTFEPKAVFLTATLSAGVEIVREIGVRSEGSLFSSGSGEGTSIVRGVGTQMIEVPAGLYEAFVVESELSFSIGPARILLTQRGWFAKSKKGVGVVAEEGRERVEVFGITAHNESRVSVLAAEKIEEE